MSLKSLLENTANENGWEFYYGREDYQNLQELSANTIALYVEPISEDPKFDEYNNATLNYSGRFLLAVNSDVDEDYPDKYEDYIRPLRIHQLPKMLRALHCASYQINQFKILEAINVDDQNLDGLLVNFHITLID